MPWSNQGGSGGPWGGGGGSGGGGPWGQRPGGGGAPTPPNIEDMIRRGQDRIRNLLPGGLGGGRGLLLVVLVFVAIWLASGIYKVEPDEQGVLLRFGKWNGTTTGPGLHYWWPAPIGERLTPKVTVVNRADIGFADTRRGGGTVDVTNESLMLTGDQNIADVDFTVQWVIGNAGEFLFNIRDPEGTVKIVAESAMREIVGQTTLTTLLTGGRTEVEEATRDLLQGVLDDYKAGVQVQRVQLLQVDPPTQVIDAFNEVQRARQDKTRLRNQAEAYENRIVPTARGEAASVVQQATAFKERITKEAEGEAQQFLSIYASYAIAKDITRRRLYLETLREVLAGANKVIIDQSGTEEAQGVIPFLPLTDLARRGAAGEAQ